MSITGHLVRRMLLIIPMMIGITLLLFTVTHLVPANPLVVILNEKSQENPETVQSRYRKMGIGQTLTGPVSDLHEKSCPGRYGVFL